MLVFRLLAHEQTQLQLKDHEVNKHRGKRSAPVAPVFLFFSFLFCLKETSNLCEFGFPGAREFLGSPCSSDRVFGVNGFGLWSIPRGKLDEVCRRSWRFSLLPEMKVLVVTRWTLRDCLFRVEEGL